MAFNRQEGWFTNHRGQRLHTLSYTPVQRVEALLLFHHGYGEHSGRYEPVFEMLSSSGIAVHTYDAHGHGRSEPLEEWDRHLIWNFDHLVNDWAAYAALVKAEHAKQLPCFIGGHSMGALTSTLVALRDQSAWQGLVCCSATVDVEWNWFLKLQASIGGLLAAIVPRARIVPAVKGEDMSTDPQAIEQMEADPLNASGNVRARTANEFLKAFRRIFEHEHELQLPIYAHHGSCDRLANLNAVKRMLRNSQSRDVTLYEVEGGFHEVMMGSERQDVTQRLIEWLSGQASYCASQPPASQPDVLAHNHDNACMPPKDGQRDEQASRPSTSSDDSSTSCTEAEPYLVTQQRQQSLPRLQAGAGHASRHWSTSQPASPVAVASAS